MAKRHPPSERQMSIADCERSLDRLSEAISIQHARLIAYSLPGRATNRDDAEMHARTMADIRRVDVDFDYLVIALRRLVRLGEAVVRAGYGDAELKTARKEFDTATPGLL